MGKAKAAVHALVCMSVLMISYPVHTMHRSVPSVSNKCANVVLGKGECQKDTITVVRKKVQRKKRNAKSSFAVNVKKYWKRLCRIMPKRDTVLAGVGVTALVAYLSSTDVPKKSHNKEPMTESEYYDTLFQGQREAWIRGKLTSCGFELHCDGTMENDDWIKEAAKKSWKECVHDIHVYKLFKVALEAKKRRMLTQNEPADNNDNNGKDNGDEDQKEEHCNIVSQQKDELNHLCRANPWLGDVALLRSPNDREQLLDYLDQKRVKDNVTGAVRYPAIMVLRCGDLVGQSFDPNKRNVIVSAANKHMDYVGMSGVAKAIGDVAGAAELEADLKEQLAKDGKEAVTAGEVMVSDSFGLQQRGVSRIIHAVAPDCRIEGEQAEWEKLLKQAYESTLKMAITEKAQRLYLPSLGTAIFKCPIEQATLIALKTVAELLGSPDFDPDRCLEKVVFVAYGNRTCNTYKACSELANVHLVLDDSQGGGLNNT